jgi:broad specificity phosphatase PhoE
VTDATITLIRHGQTAWSLSGQHTGRTDIPLTRAGELEVKALAPFLRADRFSAVLTSPLLRARQTCALAGMSSGAIIEPDLIEWNYGDYEGRRSVDIRRERPGWAIYRDGCPGGESPAEVSARADRVIGKLDEFGSSIALFSHGQFACSLAARWVGLDIIEAEHLALDTASISILGHSRSRPGTRVIELWNFVPGRLATLTQTDA